MSRGIRAVAILVVVLGAAAAIVLGVFQIRSIDVKEMSDIPRNRSGMT